MNWLTRTISKVFPKKKKSLDIPEESWQRCPQCQTMHYHTDLENNLMVCHNCDFHFKINPYLRFKTLFDNGAFEEVEYDTDFNDPLKFKDLRTYKDRWHEARAKSGSKEVMVIGVGSINGVKTCVCSMNWFFMGASVGLSGAEGLIAAAEKSCEENIPLVVICCSGGMRMQQGALSLSTLQKCTVAMSIVKESKLPTVCLLTDATTGGVSASFASLGDIILAEPGATIGFSGARVASMTINEVFPEDLQKSETLLKNGFIDMIVHRSDFKNKVSQILKLLTKKIA